MPAAIRFSDVNGQAEINAVIGDNRGFAIDLKICGIHGRYLCCGPHYRVADDMGEGDFATAAAGQVVIYDNPVIEKQLRGDRAHAGGRWDRQASFHVGDHARGWAFKCRGGGA